MDGYAARAVVPLDLTDRGHFGTRLSEAPRPERRRVLLAGTDPAQGLMLARTLEAGGYSVLVRDSGRGAVTALLTAAADLLFINTPLGDGSASALVRWVRARQATAGMVCIVKIAAGETRLAADLYDAGADLVIAGRAHLDLLPRQVAAALARRPLAVAP